MSKLQRAKDRIERVASDVAQGSCPKIPPTAPLEGRVRGVIWPRRGWSQLQIPVQSFGDGRCLGWSVDPLRPVLIKQPIRWPVGPNMRFTHRADGIVPDHLAKPPGSFRSLALIAHLGRHFVFAGGLSELAGFPNRVRKG